MRHLKIVIIILSTSLFLFSCSGLKKGFSNQKKNNSDEFLVEKKAPLVMPPDYKELPKPKTNQETSTILWYDHQSGFYLYLQGILSFS